MPTAGRQATKDKEDDKEDVPARWVAFPLHMAVVCLLLAPADYLSTGMLCTAWWHVLLAPLVFYALAKLVRLLQRLHAHTEAVCQVIYLRRSTALIRIASCVGVGSLWIGWVRE